MSGKYRLLYVDTSPAIGGSVFSLYDLCRGLNRERYEPVVVTYAAHPYVQRFRELDVPVYVWDGQGLSDHRPAWMRQQREATPLRWLRTTRWGNSVYHAAGLGVLMCRRIWPQARRLQRVIVDHRISLVHTNVRVGHDRAGIVAARLAGVPCVCHVRDYEALNWLDRRLAGWTHEFIYISRALQESHVRAGAVRSKGRVVYNGIDVDAFVSGANRDEGRQTLGLKPDDRTIGLIGRLERWKGHEVFLRAIALLHGKLPLVKARIVGNAVPYDPGYGNELRGLCSSLGLDAVVDFVDFRPDVARVMSALDVVVLASTKPEPFGRVLIEAMATGRPVVATDAGASREIVDDGVQGLLVPPDDAEAMANSLIRILTSPGLATEMGRQGEMRVRERFGLEQYVRGVEAVYAEMLH